MNQKYLIGIDIGGTKIAAGLVDRNTGEVVAQVRHETPKTGNSSILTCVGDSIQELLAQTEELVIGIGVGIPGLVDRSNGIALEADNLNFSNMPVAEYIWNRFHIPAYIENDTNGGILGEKWFGHGKGLQDFVYLALGTGIGGGLIFGGKLYLGKSHAGEIGHMIINPSLTNCICGAPGCIESLASGTAIARHALERLGEGTTSSLQHLLQLGQPITAKDVFDAASAGDTLAKKVVAETGRYLAYALTTLIQLLDPEAIIIGGGVSRSKNLLREAILDGAPYPAIREQISQVLCFSQWTTGIIGAASVVLERRMQRE